MGLLAKVLGAMVNWLEPDLVAEVKAADLVTTSVDIPKVAPYYNNIPRFKDWSTDNATREGMFVSTWVYACVSLRAKCIGSVPWIVEERVGHDEEDWRRIDHPIERLLRVPNKHQHGRQLFQLCQYHKDLGGDAFWHLIVAGGEPRQIWPLKPDFTRPIPSVTDFIGGYYIWIGGVPFILPPSEVCHHMCVNPFDDYLGVPPLRAAWLATQTDVQATEWNRRMLDNRAVSDIILSPKDMLDQDSWEELRNQVREQHQGAEHNHSPWVLGGGINVERLGLNAVEMDFLESRRWGREEICAVFGIPLPVLTGSKQHNASSLSTGSNDTEVKSLWANTLIPQLDELESQLNLSIMPYYDEGALYGDAKLRIRYDTTNVPAMQTDYTCRVNNANILVAMGVPLKAVNRRLELGFHPSEIPEPVVETPEADPIDPTVVREELVKRAKQTIAEHKQEMADRSPNQAVQDYSGVAVNKPNVMTTPIVAANLPGRAGVN